MKREKQGDGSTLNSERRLMHDIEFDVNKRTLSPDISIRLSQQQLAIDLVNNTKAVFSGSRKERQKSTEKKYSKAYGGYFQNEGNFKADDANKTENKVY